MKKEIKKKVEDKTIKHTLIGVRREIKKIDDELVLCAEKLNDVKIVGEELAKTKRWGNTLLDKRLEWMKIREDIKVKKKK